MHKTVAILTPAYNRAYILHNLYESLCAQTCFDFKWYIVDDGSTDDTRELCASFHSEDFEIAYVYKENGGKHTAVNLGIDLIVEDLIFIVDSDDRLTQNAVEVILQDWESYKNRDDIAALSYYRCHPDGKIIGDSYGSDTAFVDSYINIRINKEIRGDKAEVFVADVLKQFRFPVYENEKFLTESVLWMAISKAGYQYAYNGKAIYICEYLEDGLTRSGKAKIIQNPLGTRAHALSYLCDEIELRLQWKYAILYNIASNLARISFRKRLNDCPMKLKCLFTYPLGLAGYLYLQWKWRKNT
ncbi:MAG: glycosyltransferase family 2 protein [Ruminococcaceae bacterium]|nr:glycosyltransferase family 2 protein [Oscillospiraceae bacterium]